MAKKKDKEEVRVLDDRMLDPDWVFKHVIKEKKKREKKSTKK